MDRKNYPNVPTPLGSMGAFCHAVRVGDWLYMSGMTANGSPETGSDITKQTEEACERIGKMLAAEGGTFADVVKVTVYVTDLDDLAKIHEVRHRYFGQTLPASTLVKVAGLINEAKIESEAVAKLNE